MYPNVANLDVDRLGDVVGKKRGVSEVGGIFLVLAPLAPRRYNVGVPNRGGGGGGGTQYCVFVWWVATGKKRRFNYASFLV